MIIDVGDQKIKYQSPPKLLRILGGPCALRADDICNFGVRALFVSSRLQHRSCGQVRNSSRVVCAIEPTNDGDRCVANLDNPCACGVDAGALSQAQRQHLSSSDVARVIDTWT